MRIKLITQEQRIYKKLKQGRVSRNWALDNRITSRLSAYILEFKKAGYEFSANYTADREDYLYIVTKRP